MAEYGEWNRKGATLSDVTAKKEYGVTRDFIVKGVNAGALEFREGAVWGSPYLRILRSQLQKIYRGGTWLGLSARQKGQEGPAHHPQGDH
jgi:hypothetical protein